jgi:hypothetical protein
MASGENVNSTVWIYCMSQRCSALYGFSVCPKGPQIAIGGVTSDVHGQRWRSKFIDNGLVIRHWNL